MKPNKKIVILSPSLRGGGTEREMLLLASELSKRGFDCDLVIINDHNNAYIADPGVNVINLRARRIRYALLPLLKYLGVTQPKVLFSAETPVNALVVFARILCGYPRRLIVSERNHISSYSSHSVPLLDKGRPWIAKYLYPMADDISTVSSGVADDLIKSVGIDPQKIHMIHNLYDVQKMVDLAKEIPLHPWFANSQIPIFINVGRLVPQKDQVTLIRSFAIVRSKLKCRLLILGEGSERRRLEELVRDLGIMDDVLMPGFVANPFAFIAHSRVFVLTSAWEGLPGVLIEALALGVPIVSTDCPSGPAEILENGKYGALTSIGNPDVIATAILETMKSPISTKVLQARALDFSVENVLPKYIELLSS